MTEDDDEAPRAGGILDRAIRLFQFLARAQQIKSRTPRTLETYERDGDVVWFHALPNHWAITTPYLVAGADPLDPMLTIERVPRLPPPSPPENLANWLSGPIELPESEPELLAERIVEGDGADEYSTEPEIQNIEENPAVVAAYERWVSTWRSWAATEVAASVVRELYGRAFSVHLRAKSYPEEFEVVCGVACLGWQPDGSERTQRHTLTAAAAVDFDDDTGRLTVRAIESTDTLSLELDMLDPAVIQDPQRISEIRVDAASLDAHALDRDEVSLLGRRLAHCLDSAGQYSDDDQPPAAGPEPAVTYAPAIILRRRSQQGLVHVFEAIANQMRDAGKVPEGILPLIDPNHQPNPGLSWEGADGAIVRVDDEIFLPLPVNEAQLRVIRRVDASAQTLVQGPPGTGKTHTAAALISHLLAQGKRVLVTAQTDRALKEVRTKLPDSIKPLSVAVVGSGREDMTDLKIAVARIAAAASEYEDEAARGRIEQHLEEIDVLRRLRAGLHHRLIEVREAEVRRYERPGVTGTLAQIAQIYERSGSDFSWIRDLTDVPASSEPPITDSEILEWRRLIRDDVLRADEALAMEDLVDAALLPGPEAFFNLVQVERDSGDADRSFEDVHGHEAFKAFIRLAVSTRDTNRTKLHRLVDEAETLARRHEAWMASALLDIRRGRATPWRARCHELTSLVVSVRPLLSRLGSVRQIRCNADPGPLLAPLIALREYIDKGGKLKTDAAGHPKVGTLAARPIKAAAPLFEAISIDGVPPTNIADLDHVATWINAERILDAMDRAWPDGVPIPPEDTLSERLHWHVAELEQLERLLTLADELSSQDAALSELGLRPIDWGDLTEVQRFGRALDAVDAREILDAAQRPLSELEETVRHAARSRNVGQCILDLDEAVRSRAPAGYGQSWSRLQDLLRTRDVLRRRDDLGAQLAAAAPRLHAALLGEPALGRWDELVERFESAWNWASTAAWISDREQVDVNLLQRHLDVADEDIRRHVGELAAERAWQHAVSSDRMTGEARANLEHYAFLVRSLGKGTGKYAPQRRSDIREAMDRCRPSVPVWIMPIYRVAEQLRVAPDIFDVVVVDEASQAGLGATFLQYLAPKIVVIGDDKQVSPAAVGVDQQQLRDLAAQYLHDDPFRASWEAPGKSLFDEAKMRYGGLITLVEHRRCVPEIIGFSNRVAYEPEGIRLIPVRQYGADRLEPIRPIFLPEGYTRGGQTKINPVEVEAIVDQIEKCLADPAYDGLTFGVISLLGEAQAKQIEKGLLERISPEEWTARDLRCGDSAAFQGSERDVIFLSMVAATEPGRRLTALTHQMYLQRYNVAASRAKDQMWLYHSVELSELGNTEDLRFQLLDYCYATVNRSTQVETRFTNSVPEDVKVSPFDSLFEQRVFNRLIDRGYSVIPQYEVERYRIDLVILGSKTKVAIECDGDTWHGPDRYEADLGRKRDLERCGWKFFNIRESLFYVDRAAALAPLWEMLAVLEVHPSGWVPPPKPTPTFIPRPQQIPNPPDIAWPPPKPIPTVIPRTASRPSAPMSIPVFLNDESQIASNDPDRHDDKPETEPKRLGTSNEIDPPKRSISAALPLVAADQNHATHAGLDDHELAAPVSIPSSLAAYREFAGTASPALTASSTQLLQEILAIVEDEGPVLGDRLHQAHVRAAGGQRVGRQIAHALNSAINTAKRRGLLLEANPLSDSGVKPLTYRLPNQPSIVMRQLGPRTLEQVPPEELAALMRDVAGSVGWWNEEVLFRTVLERYGLRRLTTNATAHLGRIRHLAEMPG